MQNKSRSLGLSLGLVAALVPGIASAADIFTCAAPVIRVTDRQICNGVGINFTSNANPLAVGLSVQTFDTARFARVINRGFDRQRIAIGQQCQAVATSAGNARSISCSRPVEFHQSSLVAR